jgi:hypothetical protein
MPAEERLGLVAEFHSGEFPLVIQQLRMDRHAGSPDPLQLRRAEKSDRTEASLCPVYIVYKCGCHRACIDVQMTSDITASQFFCFLF